ncbi:hypothetical protein [Amphibacillus jilinensis]|nr:hypothetical protein [Amphibacillus jilinensis]
MQKTTLIAENRSFGMSKLNWAKIIGTVVYIQLVLNSLKFHEFQCY